MTTLQRLFDPRFAFESPVTVAFAVGCAVLMVLGFVAPALLQRLGKIDAALADEVRTRTRTWVWLGALLLGATLLGAFWVWLGLLLLALLCYGEFARATGLFRSVRVTLAVLASIGLLFLAVLDHWYGLFAAAMALGPVLIAAVAVTADRPKGYIQRVALGVFGFGFVGVGLAHLAYIANDADYRPLLLTLVAAVQLNDVFAFVSGKALGKRKLCVNTSPGKTIAGALGALLGTTLLVYVAGGLYVEQGFTRYAPHLIGLGLLLSVSGQLGDLMLSSVKRDLGIKDMGAVLPGHGGLLDRFDSLLLSAPIAFHYLSYFRGIGMNQSPHTISGPLLGLP